jgi:AcrR family transcriptional regulator
MPTGVALGNARGQLFAAAERILVREGPGGLTSRAVTTEAGCAKGVLHRYFPDFDAFLAELVVDRVHRLPDRGADLMDRVGTATIAANVARSLVEIFDPVAVAVVALVTARDELRVRLRDARSASGIPLMAEATDLIAAYLSAERELGRLDAGADVRVLAPMILGGAHLLFADREGPAPTREAIQTMSEAVIGTGAGEDRADLTPSGRRRRSRSVSR